MKKTLKLLLSVADAAASTRTVLSTRCTLSTMIIMMMMMDGWTVDANEEDGDGERCSAEAEDVRHRCTT